MLGLNVNKIVDGTRAFNVTQATLKELCIHYVVVVVVVFGVFVQFFMLHVHVIIAKEQFTFDTFV